MSSLIEPLSLILNDICILWGMYVFLTPVWTKSSWSKKKSFKTGLSNRPEVPYAQQVFQNGQVPQTNYYKAIIFRKLIISQIFVRKVKTMKLKDSEKIRGTLGNYMYIKTLNAK